MGNIVVANLTANLLLDTHQFDDAEARANARMDALAAKAANLAGQAQQVPGQNVGQDSEVTAAQAREMARATEAARFAEMTSRMTALTTSMVEAEERAFARRKLAFEGWVQTELLGLAQIQAALDRLSSKHDQLSRTTRPRGAAPEEAHTPISVAEALMDQGTKGAPTGTALTPVALAAMLTSAYEQTRQARPSAPVAVAVEPVPVAAPPVRPVAVPAPAPARPLPPVDDEYLKEEALRAEAERKRVANLQALQTKGKMTDRGPWEQDEGGWRYSEQEAVKAPALSAAQLSAAQEANYPGWTAEALAEQRQKQRDLAARLARIQAGEQVAPLEDLSRVTGKTVFEQLRNAGVEVPPEEEIPPELLQGGLPAELFEPSRHGLAIDPTTLRKKLAQLGMAPGAPAPGPARQPPTEGEEEEPGPRRAQPFFPWVTPARRGQEESLSYQRYQMMQAPGFGLLERVVQPISPMAGEALLGLAGPQLALAAGATALGVALKKAADAAEAYAAAQFQVTEQTKGTPLGPGGLQAGFLAEQEQRMRGFGVSGVQEQGLLGQLTRYTTNAEEIKRVQQESLDFARAFGISVQQAQTMFVEASQGQTGAFHQFIPTINQGDTLAYVEEVVNRRFGGAAERFMGTPQGAQAKLEADWNDLLTSMGQDLLPLAQRLIGVVDASLPAVEAAAKGITLVVDALGDVVTVGGVLVQGVTTLVGLIPGVKQFFDTITQGAGDWFSKSGQNMQRGTNYIETSQTQFFQATGLMQNERGEWGQVPQLGDIWPGTQPGPGGRPVQNAPRYLSYEEQMKRLAPLNPQLAGVAPGQEMTPGQLNVAEDRLRMAMPNEEALAKAAAARAFTTEGKFLGTPINLGASGLSDSQLANTAQASVSAMRLIEEEVSSTLQAVEGVQNVYAKLTSFHVDFSTVKGNLDNLQSGITYLQRFWIDTANSLNAGISQHEYQIAETWLNMTNAMLTTMKSGTEVLAQVYTTSAEMPSEAQIDQIVLRLRSSFMLVNRIAHEAMPGASAGEQTKNTAIVQAWTTSMAGVMTLLGSGTKVLADIFALPIPDPDQQQRVADGIVTMLTGFTSALGKAFVKAQEQGTGQALTVSIDSGLANAAAMAQNANQLIALASGGADLFAKMRGLYVPSDGEIQAVVDRAMSVTDKMAAEIRERLARQRQTESKDVPEEPGMWGYLSTSIKRVMAPAYNEITVPNLDPVLKAAGDYADNASKIVAVVLGSVNTFQQMRGMHIPDFSVIDLTNKAVAHMVENMAAYGQDPAALVKAGKWADDAGKLVSVVQGGVGTFNSMRFMHVPSEGEMQATVGATVSMIDRIAAMLPQNSDTALIKASIWARDAGSIVAVLQGGTEVFKGMRFLHVPGVDSIRMFTEGLDLMVSMTMPLTSKYSDPMLVKAKEWADSMGPIVSTLATGVEVLKGVRSLLPPGVEQMANFRAMLGGMVDSFMSATTEWNIDMLDRAKEWGDDMGPFMQALSAGVQALQGIRDLRVPSEQAIEDFAEGFHLVSSAMMAEVVKDGWVATDRALEWGNAMAAMMGGVNGGADLLAKLRDLREPTRESADAFVGSVEYMSARFVDLAQKYSPDIEAAMTGYGQTMQAVFQGLAPAEDLLQKLPDTAYLSEEMIGRFFDNIDQGVDQFARRASEWKANMSFENAKFSVELGQEFEALQKASSFFNSLGGIRVDYRGQVNMFFANLYHAVDEFEAGAEQWKGQMGEGTHRISQYMTEEFQALNAAVEPMTKMELASHAQPGMVGRVFNNVKLMVAEFATLANAPELQGTKLGGLAQFAGQMNDIFGAIKNATDAATELNTPAGQLGGGNFTSVMEAFFLRDVPTYAKAWDVQMGLIAGSAERASGRVATALGNTGITQAVAGLNKQGLAPSAHAGAAPTYQGCIFLNGVQIGQGQDVKSILRALTEVATTKEGGVPVNAAPLR